MGKSIYAVQNPSVYISNSDDYCKNDMQLWEALLTELLAYFNRQPNLILATNLLHFNLAPWLKIVSAVGILIWQL